MKRMSVLGPKARALLESGRAASRPTAADRTRIEAALRARLGAQALNVDATPHAPAAAVSQGALGPTLLGSALGLLLGGGIALWALGAHRPPPLAAGPLWPASVAKVEAKPAPQPSAAVASKPAAAPTPAATKPARATPGRSDSLAQEVTLLTRATRELAQGHAARALRALDEHQQRFPDGKLSEERRAAKARALCALGQVSEGRAEQAQLSAASPAAARAKHACDLAARRAER